MKFLKLLDPHDCPSDEIAAVGRQQRIAAAEFPILVEKSNLHYWGLGDEIYALGSRLLIGLNASFDLCDLHLADIINHQLNGINELYIDVFNLADCTSIKELVAYFPGLEMSNVIPSPIVGLWDKGVHKYNLWGFDARKFILRIINSKVTAEESVMDLNPPRREFLEDA